MEFLGWLLSLEPKYYLQRFDVALILRPASRAFHAQEVFDAGNHDARARPSLVRLSVLRSQQMPRSFVARTNP